MAVNSYPSGCETAASTRAGFPPFSPRAWTSTRTRQSGTANRWAAPFNVGRESSQGGELRGAELNVQVVHPCVERGPNHRLRMPGGRRRHQE